MVRWRMLTPPLANAGTDTARLQEAKIPPGSRTMAPSVFPLASSACHQARTPPSRNTDGMAEAPATAQRRGGGTQTHHGAAGVTMRTAAIHQRGQRSLEPEHSGCTQQA